MDTHERAACNQRALRVVNDFAWGVSAGMHTSSGGAETMAGGRVSPWFAPTRAAWQVRATEGILHSAIDPLLLVLLGIPAIALLWVIFHTEIHEQPAALARLLSWDRSEVNRVASLIRERRIGGLVLAARGSSDHAAQYAGYRSRREWPSGHPGAALSSYALRVTTEPAGKLHPLFPNRANRENCSPYFGMLDDSTP